MYLGRFSRSEFRRCSFHIINCILNIADQAGDEWRGECLDLVRKNMSFKNPGDLVLIIQSLCRKLMQDPGKTEKPAIHTIDEMIEYIDAHFCDSNFSIKWLSAEFRISGSNFSHQFKARKGLTLTDYLLRLKINYARQLLENSGMSVRQVSEKLGYTHPSSFIRKYKKITGNTPGKENKTV